MILSCHKELSALFRRIKLKHDNDFYCLNCFLFISVKAKKLQLHEKVGIQLLCLMKVVVY